MGKPLPTSHHISGVFLTCVKVGSFVNVSSDLKPCETDLRHVLASGAEGPNDEGNGIS